VLSWHRLASLRVGARLGMPETIEFRPERAPRLASRTELVRDGMPSRAG
jgi:hypothetical protein